MKKIISLTLAALMLIGVLAAAPTVASALDADYEYDVLENGTAALTYYYDGGTAIEIPSELDGYTVSEIAEYAIECYSATSISIPASIKAISPTAFVLCDNIEEFTVDSDSENYCAVDGDLYNKTKTVLVRYASGKKAVSFAVPDSVTAIEAYALSYTYALTDVTIPSSLTSIGDSAFDNSGITSVTVPDSVTTLGNDVFADCEYLTTAALSSNIMSIPNFAFYNCESLANINIPDSVTLIGESAFSYCEALTSVNTGKNVESIGQKAFRGCININSITITEKVAEIDNAAFSDCASLSSIVVEAGNTNFCAVDGDLYNFEMTSLIQYAIGKTATEFTMPDGVETICANAFEDAGKLTSVTICDDVQIIDSKAFSDCRGLTSIVIPDNVYYIGDYAFAYCTGAETITIGSSVEEISNGAFYYCSSVESITIPDSVTYMDEEVFEYCESLSSVKIGKGLSFIPDFCFCFCTNLKSVTIGAGVKEIGAWVFYDCPNLKSVSIPKNVKTIGEGAFGYCYDDESGNDKKVSGFKIYGYQDTAAQTYATKNGITFDAYDKTTVKAKAAKTKIYVGGKTTVKVTVENRRGATTFTTSNKKIATVNSKGVVKGIKAGKVTITAKNNGVKSKVTIKVVKKANPIKVKVKTVKANAYSTSTFARSKILSIKKAKGKLTFTKKSGDKKITINKKTGKLTVKSGLAAGKTYSVKIAVKAAGNKTYKSATKTVTIKVKV